MQILGVCTLLAGTKSVLVLPALSLMEPIFISSGWLALLAILADLGKTRLLVVPMTAALRSKLYHALCSLIKNSLWSASLNVCVCVLLSIFSVRLANRFPKVNVKVCFKRNYKAPVSARLLQSNSPNVRTVMCFRMKHHHSSQSTLCWFEPFPLYLECRYFSITPHTTISVLALRLSFQPADWMSEKVALWPRHGRVNGACPSWHGYSSSCGCDVSRGLCSTLCLARVLMSCSISLLACPLPLLLLLVDTHEGQLSLRLGRCAQLVLVQRSVRISSLFSTLSPFLLHLFSLFVIFLSNNCRWRVW